MIAVVVIGDGDMADLNITIFQQSLSNSGTIKSISITA